MDQTSFLQSNSSFIFKKCQGLIIVYVVFNIGTWKVIAIEIYLRDWDEEFPFLNMLYRFSILTPTPSYLRRIVVELVLGIEIILD